ncbi:PhnD/SsuA/transferrin family substrate-binding protein [Flexistipes sinusarabici]|nr:PhnD/SsuA/transferrin family substrate-binding protein [Flexistipes sinusarabici]
MNKQKLSAVCLFILFFCVFSQPSNSTAHALEKNVSIGVLAKRGETIAHDRWDATAKYLSREVKGYNFRIVPLGFDDIFKAAENGSVDFFITNSAYYVALEYDFGAKRIATLTNEYKGKTTEFFAGVVFTKKNREDVNSFKDLKGKSFMAVDPFSFGGWLVAKREFLSAEINPDEDFSKLLFGETHDAVVLAVKNGDVDVGTVRTGTLERMESEGLININNFKIINKQNYENFPFVSSTRFYPEWPISKAAHTDTALAEKVLVVLLNMQPDSKTAKNAHLAGWTIPDNYQSVEDCLKAVMVRPFENWGEITLKDILRQYGVWFFVVVTLPVFVFLLLAIRQRDILKIKNAEISKSEENLRTTLNSIGDAVISTDSRGRIERMNPVAEKLTGWDIADAVKKPLYEIFEIRNAQTGKRIKNPTEKVINIGRVIGLANHTLLVSKDGNEYQIADSAAPIKNKDGEITGVVMVFRDVTEEYNMREALKESREKYKTLYDNAPLSYQSLDEKGYIIDVNPAWLRTFGYSKDEVVGSWIGDFLHPDFRKNFARKFEIFKKRGYAHDVHLKIRHKDGHYIDMLQEGSIGYYEDGSFKQTYCVLKDITDRLKAEEALKKSNRALKTLSACNETMVWAKSEKELLNDICRIIVEEGDYKLAWVGVVQHDEDKTVKPVAHYGFKDDYLENVKISWGDNPKGRGPTGKCIREGVPEICRDILTDPEYKVWRDEALKRGYKSSIALPLKEAGEVFGALNIYAKDPDAFGRDELRLLENLAGDLSYGIRMFRIREERKRARNELFRMQKLESVGTLAAGIAHDFNNLLTALFGNISLAKMKLKADHPAYEALNSAEKAMDRATSLTNQLLTFSKGGEPLKKKVEIDVIVKKTVEFDLSGSNVKAVFEQKENLWPVLADKGQIQQVISNLVINAKQAMPEGGHFYVTMENVDTEKSEIPAVKEGKYVRISFKDEGVGIKKKDIGKIFDPFFTTKEIGSGLGLATAYSIIRKHGGYIDVESTPGMGTTFFVYLPAVSREESDKKTYVRQFKKDKRLRVLLMDDDDLICDSVKIYFENFNFIVDCVPDGETALEEYKNLWKEGKRYDVVIMDLTIPKGMGGEETVCKLLEIDPDAVCMVSSGYTDDPVMAYYEDYGFKGALTKPFHLEELKDLLRKL